MENEKRLILVDAHKLKETLTECFDEIKSIRPTRLPLMQTLLIWQGLCDIPTVDAVEVVHGYWEKEHDDLDIDRGWKCRHCKGSVYQMTYESYQYCPHCGAKMDGGNEDG